MALATGSLIEIVMDMSTYGQQTLNVWQYEITNYTGSGGAIGIAEAYWNQVKDDYRALCVTTGLRVFNAVVVRELNNPTGALASFSVPAAESDGTRVAGTLGAFMPVFVAAGVRLTVSSRVTRSGQKRLPFMTEGDVESNLISPTFTGLVSAVMDAAIGSITLGLPALADELQTIVCRKDSTGAVTAHQNVTGYIVSPYATSQNTRKIGRGS
jgi:hypothetical protein